MQKIAVHIACSISNWMYLRQIEICKQTKKTSNKIAQMILSRKENTSTDWTACKNKHNYPNRFRGAGERREKMRTQRNPFRKWFWISANGSILEKICSTLLPMSLVRKHFTKNTIETYNIEYTLSKSQKHNQTHIGTTTVTQTNDRCIVAITINLHILI